MDADIAWDSFRKSSEIRKASVSGKLDTIAAQLNDIKTDTERTATMVPKIMGDETALADAGTDSASGPAPAGMPPTEGSVPPTEAVPANGMGQAPAAGDEDMADKSDEDTGAGAGAGAGVADEPAGPTADTESQTEQAGGAGPKAEASGPESLAATGGADANESVETGGKAGEAGTDDDDTLSDEDLDRYLAGNDEEEEEPSDTAESVAGGSDKIRDAIKGVAMKAFEEGDADTLREVADILGQLKGGKPEEEDMDAEETSEPEDLTDETSGIGKCSKNKPMAESDGPAVNQILSDAGTGPVIGTEGVPGECPMAAEIKAKFGLPDDVDLGELAHALAHLDADPAAGPSQSMPEGVSPTGKAPSEEKVIEIEVEPKKEDEKEEEEKDSEEEEEEKEEEEKKEPKEEAPSDFRSMLKVKKSAHVGIDGKYAIVKNMPESEGDYDPTAEGDEELEAPADEGQGSTDTPGLTEAEGDGTQAGTGGFGQEGEGTEVDTEDDGKTDNGPDGASGDGGDASPAVEGGATAPQGDTGGMGVEGGLNAVGPGEGTTGPGVSGQAGANTAQAGAGAVGVGDGGDFAKAEEKDVPAKHIVSMKELINFKKSGSNRPDDVSSINADLGKPDLEKIRKSNSETVRMGRGVDPHKVVENDLKMYNLFKSGKGF